MNPAEPISDIIPVDGLMLMAALAAAGAASLRLHLPEPPAQPPLLLRPLTCVELLKRLLGLRQHHLITPWQLYRWLAGAGKGVNLR